MVDCDEHDMDKTRDEHLQQREKYKKLFESTAALLFRHDPVGMAFEHNKDEYLPEAGTILPRLNGCQSEADVLPIVYEEFLHWFGNAAGTRERYVEIASEIWDLWQAYRSDGPSTS